MRFIEEFMQCYFTERTQLLRTHEDVAHEMDSSFFTESHLNERKQKRDDSRCLENDAPPSVINVVNHGLSTEVVSSEPEGESRKQYRYTLISTGGGWQIAKILEECWFCGNPELEIEHQCENGWIAINYCF